MRVDEGRIEGFAALPDRPGDAQDLSREYDQGLRRREAPCLDGARITSYNVCYTKLLRKEQLLTLQTDGPLGQRASDKSGNAGQ